MTPSSSAIDRSPTHQGRDGDPPAACEGHLFVVQGDLRQLGCDAWLLPTDERFSVSASFAAAVGLSEPGVLLGRRWDGAVVAPFAEREVGQPWVWLGNAGRAGAGPEHFAGVAVAFVEEAAGALHRDGRFAREVPLLAVNVLGSGHGGLRAEKGDLHRHLLPALEEAASRSRCDVVLVTWGHKAYAAAQRVRRRLVEDVGASPDPWRSLPQTLIATAGDLAFQARRGNLVLFLGAGVSTGAGLPAWHELVAQLAALAGLDTDERAQLARFDLRDQASIIGRRLQRQGTSIGQEVATRFASTRTSLNRRYGRWVLSWT